MMLVNENLIRLRKSKGLSQEELGNELNVARQTISKWELGETTPEMDKLIKLSNIFDISVDELIGNDYYVKDSIQNKGHFKIRGEYEYISKTKIKGIPLVHINVGFGLKKAKGIIAIGNMAQGFISIGLVALGIISFGGIGIGLITTAAIALGLLCAIGGIAVGGLAIGGIAIGLLAIGGLSMGMYAIGGCAIAKNVALGDYASGYIAIGNHLKGTVKIVSTDAVSSGQIRNTILKYFPKTWGIIVDLFAGISL